MVTKIAGKLKGLRGVIGNEKNVIHDIFVFEYVFYKINILDMFKVHENRVL